MVPEDIRRQVVAEEHDVSRDGRSAVVSRRFVRGRHYLAHLWVVPLDGGRPRRLTDGPVRDTWPRICPDGEHLAFIRNRPEDEDEPARVCVMSLSGGRVQEIVPRRFGGAGELAWSPDGRRLAFTAEVDPPRFLVGKVPPIGGPRRSKGGKGAKTKDEPSPLARRITRTDWRWDGSGHVDRWSHLFVLGPAFGSRPRQVTSGDWGVSDIAWHPDARTVGFTSDRGPEPDLRPRTTIWSVDVDEPDAEPREILAPAGYVSRAAFSPDGRWVVGVGVDEAEPLDDRSPELLLGPAAGGPTSKIRRLAPELDRPAGNWVDTDLTGWLVSGRSGPYWADERTIVATISDRGRSLPVRFRIDPRTGKPVGPPPTPATGPDAPEPWSDAVTHSLAVDGAGRITTLGTLGTRAMELMSLDEDGPRGPHWRTHTTFGSAWQRRFPMPEMRRVFAPGSGGPIETWIASPPESDDRALPTVVDIHGGPLGAWAPAPHVEVILLVAAGYRVVLPNIRGSATYGRGWITDSLGDWGGVDADDVHAALDHVIGLGLADPERLGVMGLSYGGFMVNWLVGTTDRFAAAVSENGVTNQINDWANSDSGPEYDRASLLGDPFSEAGIEKLWRQSPLRNVTAVRTPLLMLQAEADLRCPPQDNEQLFVALRHLGRTVEYVLYPEESHVYGSSGRIDRRIDRNTRILAWFERYLGR